MFVDACPIIAVLSEEPEAERVSRALAGAPKRITSPIAVLEAVLGLARPDKFNLPVEAVEPLEPPEIGMNRGGIPKALLF